MKNKMANITSENVAATGTNSNTIFKWSDELVEDLLKDLSNFKTVMEFHKKKISTQTNHANARKHVMQIVKTFFP